MRVVCWPSLNLHFSLNYGRPGGPTNAPAPHNSKQLKRFFRIWLLNFLHHWPPTVAWIWTAAGHTLFWKSFVNLVRYTKMFAFTYMNISHTHPSIRGICLLLAFLPQKCCSRTFKTKGGFGKYTHRVHIYSSFPTRTAAFSILLLTAVWRWAIGKLRLLMGAQQKSSHATHEKRPRARLLLWCEIEKE